MITIQSTSLYFREGNSDKEYHTAIEPSGEGYIVTFAYGRRGSNLTTGTKTPYIVSLAEATAIHAKHFAYSGRASGVNGKEIGEGAVGVRINPFKGDAITAIRKRTGRVPLLTVGQ